MKRPLLTALLAFPTALAQPPDADDSLNLKGTVLCGYYTLVLNDDARNLLNETDIQVRFRTFLEATFSGDDTPRLPDAADPDCYKKPRHINNNLALTITKPDREGVTFYDVTLTAYNAALPAYPQGVNIWITGRFGSTRATDDALTDHLVDALTDTFSRFLDAWQRHNPEGTP